MVGCFPIIQGFPLLQNQKSRFTLRILRLWTHRPKKHPKPCQGNDLSFLTGAGQKKTQNFSKHLFCFLNCFSFLSKFSIVRHSYFMVFESLYMTYAELQAQSEMKKEWFFFLNSNKCQHCFDVHMPDQFLTE